MHFTLVRITPFSSQSLIKVPKSLCDSNHWCNLGDDLEKQIAASKTKGVVGSKGKKIPITPNNKAINPKHNQSVRFITRNLN